MSFRELHVDRCLGIPTVQLNTRCTELPRAGDAVSMHLQPESVGNSSVQFTSYLAKGSSVLLATRQVLVFVGFVDDKIAKVRIPEAVREKIATQIDAVNTQ